MNIVHLLMLILYILFFGIMFYIIYSKDCRLSFYFIGLLFIISIIKLVIIFKYDDLCMMANKLYCYKK